MEYESIKVPFATRLDPEAPIVEKAQPFRLSEERFERMISEVEDYAIILLNPDGVISTWNKGAERIKGYKATDIIGKSFRLFYSREDRENGTPDQLLAEAKTKGKANHEGWRIKKDGTRFWGTVTLTALHDDAGEITGILKVTRDLTERKKNEDRHANYIEQLQLKNEELRRSEERFHKMINEVHDYSIILMDKHGTILDWNKGAEKLKGYKAEEIVGKSFRLFYPSEDKARDLPGQLLNRAIENGSVIHEGWRVRKDGSRFWGNVSITTLHDDKGNVIGFSKVTKDLTERKAAEDKLNNYTEELKDQNEALRRSEERYNKMVSEVQDYAILLLSKDGIIENWNAGAQLIKGYSAEEVIGKSYKIFYSSQDLERRLPEKLLHEAQQNGRAVHEGWRLRKDGSRFWGSVVITALHDDAGNIIGFSKVTRDLTEKKAAEDSLRKNAEELREKNRVLENLNAELSSFAYVVSHDLKEPVRKVQFFSSMMREPGRGLAEIEKLSKKIEVSAARMQHLMDDLLSYAQLTADHKLESVDLNEIVLGVKSDLEVRILEKRVNLEVGILPTIKGIPFQLNQLFLNLISNSIKFAKPEEPPHITIDASKEGTNHVITVCDNGIGFDEKYAHKIFEVFHRLHSTAEYSGTGIGLAIAKKIMINHSGTIQASSTVNCGATFRLYFPTFPQENP